MKKLLLCALALALILGQAQAAFSPGLAALEDAYQAGRALTLAVQAELEQVKEMRPDSLAALKGYLSQAQLQMQLQHAQDGDAWALKMLQGDQALLSLQGADQGAQHLLRADPPGQLYQSTGPLAPMALLTGAPQLPQPAHILRALEGALPQLYALLEPHAQASRASQSIRGVGTGRQRIEYKLSADEWNALWPLISEGLASALAEPLATRPDLLQQVRDTLKALRFESAGTFRRILTREGEPLGLQLTATLSRQGQDARKLNLLIGSVPDSAFYLSLKAPALKGRNQLTVELQLKQGAKAARRSLDGSGNLSYRLEQDSGRYRLALKLSSEDKDGAEQLSGSLSLQEVGGQRRRWSLTPQLQLTADEAAGTLHYKAEQGRQSLLALQLRLRLAQAEALKPLQAEGALPLTDADPAGLLAARDAVGTSMLDSLRGLLLSLPLPERRGLLHDIGREGRTQGDSVPVLDLPEEDDHPFVVNDGSNEEETP